MGYSSDILWHQTTKTGFKEILKSKMFKCAYSLESINWKSSNKTFAIPMISFCNIALSDLAEYLGKYGDYTIGMRKLWKYASKTSLVWYRDRNSLSLHPVMDYLHSLKSFPSPDMQKETETLLWTQISHTKNFEGPLKRRKIKCYRFFDEYEFRFVPDIDNLETEKISPILSKTEYEKYKKDNKSSVIDSSNLALGFCLNDIEYILVKDKGQLGYVNSLLKKYFTDEVIEKQRKPIILTNDEVRRSIIGIGHHKYE